MINKNLAKMNIAEIKRVEPKLSKNGYDYTQVLRGERSLLYAQSVTPKTKQYEVFKLKIRKAELIKGAYYPEREIFPGNEDFGVWAWSYTNKDDAINKFKELENENK